MQLSPHQQYLKVWNWTSHQCFSLGNLYVHKLILFFKKCSPITLQCRNSFTSKDFGSLCLYLESISNFYVFLPAMSQEFQDTLTTMHIAPPLIMTVVFQLNMNHFHNKSSTQMLVSLQMKYWLIKLHRTRYLVIVARTVKVYQLHSSGLVSMYSIIFFTRLL